MSHSCADSLKKALIIGGSGLERSAVKKLVQNAGLDASVSEDYEDTCTAITNFQGNLVIIKVGEDSSATGDLLKVFMKIRTTPIVLIADSRLPDVLIDSAPDNLAAVINSDTDVDKITMIIQLAADGMIIRKNSSRRKSDRPIVRNLPLKVPARFVNEQSCLTSREAEVAAAVAVGSSNKEIARSLDIAVNTVNVHVNSLIKKLGVTNRTQIALWVASNNAPGPDSSALSA